MKENARMRRWIGRTVGLSLKRGMRASVIIVNEDCGGHGLTRRHEGLRRVRAVGRGSTGVAPPCETVRSDLRGLSGADTARAGGAGRWRAARQDRASARG